MRILTIQRVIFPWARAQDHGEALAYGSCSDLQQMNELVNIVNIILMETGAWCGLAPEMMIHLVVSYGTEEYCLKLKLREVM